MEETTINLDTILVDLGHFGKFQKRNYFLISLVIVFSVLPLGYIFTTRSSNYRCYINECDNENSSYHTEWIENVIPIKNEQISRCLRYLPKNDTNLNETCSKENFDSENVITCDTFIYETGDLTIEKDFNINCDKNLWKLTIIGTTNNIGELIFLPLFGYASDRYGRRTMMIISVLLSTISGFVKSFSPNYLIFVVLEFLNTSFSSGIYSVAYILAIELLTPEKRILGNTILVCAFATGEAILGTVAWISPSWRLMLRFLYAPGILFISYYWWTNESIRWLLSKGRYDETKTVLKKVAKVNGSELSENVIKMLEIVEMKAENQETVFNVFRTPKLLLRLLNCSFGWICCTFVFYGLTMHSVSIPGNLYVNFIAVAIIEIPAYLVSYYILDKIGRKFSLSFSFLLSGLTCLAIIFISDENTWIQIFFYLFGKFTITIAYTAIYVYTTEMFPTNLRHSLLALCSMFGRFGSMVAPQIPLLARLSKNLPLFLFGTLGITSGLLSLLFPETLNTKLPDSIHEAVYIDNKVEIL